MSSSNEIERFKRGSKLWHAFLAAELRVDLMQLVNDAAYEKHWIEQAIGSKNADLIAAVEEWLHGAGASGAGSHAPDQARKSDASTSPAKSPEPDPGPDANKSRYLRGVR